LYKNLKNNISINFAINYKKSTTETDKNLLVSHLLVALRNLHVFELNIFDNDGNKTITDDEKATIHTNMAEFANMDTDGNGEISKVEFIEYNKTIHPEDLDTDGNGSVSPDELLAFTNKYEEIFDKIDKDKSGSINFIEFVSSQK